MAEQIDELFVRLGLEQDRQAFKEAESSFDSLRGTALQLGAVIGAGFGLQALASDFAATVNEANDLAQTFRGLGVSAQFVDELGFAFEQVGGNSSDAAASIQRVADLIEATDWGEIPLDAFREAGFDPRLLEGVTSVADAYERLSEATRGMDPESARRALSALGFSDAEVRLFRDEDLAAFMDRGAELAQVTEEMTAAAEAFRRGSSESSRALEGIQRELAAMFAEDLGEGLSDLADVMAENRDAIVNFAEAAVPALKGAAAGIGVLVALRGSRAMLGALSNLPGATALAAGIGVGAFNLMDDEDLSEEDKRRNRIDALEFKREQIRNRLPDLPERQRDVQRDRLEEIDERLDELRTNGEDLGFNFGAGLQDQRTFNIDARGSTDPAATEEAARRGVDKALARAAENTVRDFASPVS